MSEGEVKVRRRASFSIVDDRLFCDKRLDLDTRMVAAWMLGRPDGWIIRITHMQKALGISECVWKRVRQQLVATGYFSSRRERRDDGTLGWTHVVDDAGLDGATATIPLQTIHRKSSLF